jgi:hypothetical protein
MVTFNGMLFFLIFILCVKLTENWDLMLVQLKKKNLAKISCGKYTLKILILAYSFLFQFISALIT